MLKSRGIKPIEKVKRNTISILNYLKLSWKEQKGRQIWEKY